MSALLAFACVLALIDAWRARRVARVWKGAAYGWRRAAEQWEENYHVRTELARITGGDR